MSIEPVNPTMTRDELVAAAESIGMRFPATVAQDAPLGAILNGRTHMDRLEGYPFECEAGPLTLCTDWVELRRCFEHLADWVQAMPAAPDPAPVAQGEPVAWLVSMHHWKPNADGSAHHEIKTANEFNAVPFDLEFKAPEDHYDVEIPLYAAPAPVLTPAQSLTEGALKTIAGWLADDMEEAVKNGANAVSMPDELVEIAAWIEATGKP